MSNANFDDYLNKPLGEMRRVLIPEGHYFATVRDWKTKESFKGSPMLVFTFQLSSPDEDVDTSLIPEDYNLTSKVVSQNCMLDQDFGRDDVRKTIEATGIQTDPAQPFGQYLDQTKNMPVKVYITHRPLDRDNPASNKTEQVDKVLAAG